MNNTFFDRFIDYFLLRLKEPSSWAGIFTFLTFLGVRIAPELADMITSTGITIVTGLLFAAREGRNKPDNPTLPAVVNGELPPRKPAIVSQSGENQ